MEKQRQNMKQISKQYIAHVWLAGTAIETNINGKFRITVRKNATLPPTLQNLDFPLLENANEYVVHGYTLKVWFPKPLSDKEESSPWA